MNLVIMGTQFSWPLDAHTHELYLCGYMPVCTHVEYKGAV